MSDGHHEVVIIKRGGGDHEEGHHGGAWKIAFADFMTAMMAFFLVMWLISASDKTKAVIAHYFNPVQLVDSTPQPKGLQDLKADAASIMKYTGVPSQDSTPDKSQSDSKVEAKAQVDTEAKAENKNSVPDKSAKHEQQLFRDPYAVLAEIAAKNDDQPKVSKRASTDGAKGGAGAIGLKGGDAFRDPFEPLSAPAGHALADRDDDAALARSVEAALAPQPVPPSPPAPTKAEAAEPAKLEAGKPDVGKPDVAAAMVRLPRAETPPVETPQQKAETAALQAQVAAVAEAGDPAAKPLVDVHRTSEGLVIGLTDDANFTMFASASAEPTPQTVALMARIGRLLKSRKGAVTVRGFTDNRPFRSDTYDNWRLSSARAAMAHYMLVRGGLDDARIDRIEGYADRHPKNPGDPGGPENRRIEILLREAAP